MLRIADFLTEFSSGKARGDDSEPIRSTFSLGLEPPDSREKALREAYERGYSEGRSSAMREAQAAFDRDKLQLEANQVCARTVWRDSLAGKLQADLAEGLRKVENEVVGVTSKILTEVLDEIIRERSIIELRRAIGEILNERTVTKVELTAPSDLVELLSNAEAFPELVGAKTAVGDCEVRVVIEDTVIETRMAKWKEMLRSGGN